MARAQSDLKSFSLTQYLNSNYWCFYDNDNTLRQALDNKDLKLLSDWVVSKLIDKGWLVDEAYSIIHDKDSRAVWSEVHMAMIHELKDEHIHQSVRFSKGGNLGATIDEIAKAIGVEPQYIEKPRSGRYSWDNQLAYLIHAKDLDKHLYEPSEVYTLKGESYMSIYTNSIDRWKRGGIKKANQQAQENVDWLESEILQGSIVRSQVFLTDEYYKIYALNKRRIDDAFESYGQRKMYKALEQLENNEFKISVVYIMGEAGAGKTRFAKDLVVDIIKKAKETSGEDWQVCYTASTNPIDDYHGEEILLMDDVRGSSMRADDWLKLLDPWNVSPSSARYRNKVVTARAIIITATLHPAEFFYYTKGVGKGDAQSEAIDQFLRRLMGVVQVINYDEFRMHRSIESKTSKPLHIGYDSLGNEITTQGKYQITQETPSAYVETRKGILKRVVDEIMANNNLNPKT